MTDVIKVELIHMVVPALAAAGGIVAAVLGFINHNRIRRVQVLINGRMEQLLEFARNQGRLEERGDAAGVAALAISTAAALKDSTALIASEVRRDRAERGF